MDKLDLSLIAALRQNARASLSELAAQVFVTRATVRNRIERLTSSGQIAGFTVVLKEDVQTHSVRGLMMLGIEGAWAERVMRQLTGLPQVQAVHSTNGTWDLIVELGTDTLETLDKTLFDIRRMQGVTRSETSLLLSTRLPGRR